MRRYRTLPPAAAFGVVPFVLAGWFATTPSAGPSRAGADEPRAAVCEFRNPSYAGVCTETPPIPDGQTAADACGAVLACLNDSRCVKTYCGATEIRHGWTLESVRERTEPEPQ